MTFSHEQYPHRVCGRVMLLLVLSVLVLGHLQAATTDTFNGDVDDTWEADGNWSEGTAPQVGDTVVIPDSMIVILNSSSNAIGALTVNGTLAIGAADGSTTGTLFWNSSQSFGGTGDIVFGESGDSITCASSLAETLTILSPLEIHGASGNLSSWPTPLTTIINQGTIVCDVANADFSVYNLINQGAVVATNGGTIEIVGTWSSTGTITGDNGTISTGGNYSSASAMTIGGPSATNLFIGGTVDNTGSTLALTAANGTWQVGCQILGGTITSTNPDALIPFIGNSFNGVTIPAGTTLDLAANVAEQMITFANGLTVNGTLIISGTSTYLLWYSSQTFQGSGTIEFTGSNCELFGGAEQSSVPITDILTIAPGLTIQVDQPTIFGASQCVVNNQGLIVCNGADASLSIVSVLTNSGSISVSDGASLTIGYSGYIEPWSSTGTIACNDGTLNLDGHFSASSAMTVQNSNDSIVNILGDIDNSISTLAFNAVTGSWFLDGGEIDNGNITSSGGYDLIATSAGGTLNGITIAAGAALDMTQANAQATVINGLTVNGLVFIGDANGSSTGVLYWSGTQSWSGSGSLVLGGNAGDAVVHGNSLNETLTIVPPLAYTHFLEIAATDTSCEVGVAIPSLKFTVAGLLNGDSISSVSESTTATVGSPVGTYPISVSNAVFSSGPSADYTTTYVAGVLTINPYPPTISSATTAIGQVGAAFTYQILASPAPSSYGATGLPPGVTLNSSTGLISGTPSSAGSYSVSLSATNGGGTGTASLGLTVNPATPVISSPTTASAQVGSPFSYQILASSTPATYGATGLPPGVTVGTSTGLISGTPIMAGLFTVSLSATNAGGVGTASLNLTVTPPSPVISSAASVSAPAGVAMTFQIVASNTPTSYSATGLPAGVSINTTSGLISGTPTTTAVFSIAASATNAGGTGLQTLTLTITAGVPVISSVTAAAGQVGTAFSYQTIASYSPTSYAATGLPAGLAINASSGVISGTPTTTGASVVTLSATNATGTGTGSLTITISAATDTGLPSGTGTTSAGTSGSGGSGGGCGLGGGATLAFLLGLGLRRRMSCRRYRTASH